VLLLWRSKLGTDEFLKAWEDALAFRGEQVQIFKDDESPLIGELLGLRLMAVYVCVNE